MSLITQLRTNIAALLSVVDGVGKCHEYPIESVTKSGECWLGFAVEEPIMGAREISLHSIDLFCTVNRNAQLPKEVVATEPMIGAIKTKIRGNQALGLPEYVDRFGYGMIRQAMITAGGDVEYVGFVMSLEIKTHENVAGEYGAGPA